MIRPLLLAALAAVLAAAPIGAQSDPAARDARLAAVLPPAAAAAIRARVAEVRGLGLPADAMVLRALELVAKGAPDDDIVQRVNALSVRLVLADRALRLGGHPYPAAAEVVAGADALASGLEAGQLRMLAAAVGEQPLTQRLIVVMGLLDRGIPADAALATVAARLSDRAPHPPAAAAGVASPSPAMVPTASRRGRRGGTQGRELPSRTPGPSVT